MRVCAALYERVFGSALLIFISDTFENSKFFADFPLNASTNGLLQVTVLSMLYFCYTRNKSLEVIVNSREY